MVRPVPGCGCEITDKEQKGILITLLVIKLVYWLLMPFWIYSKFAHAKYPQ